MLRLEPLLVREAVPVHGSTVRIDQRCFECWPRSTRWPSPPDRVLELTIRGYDTPDPVFANFRFVEDCAAVEQRLVPKEESTLLVGGGPAGQILEPPPGRTRAFLSPFSPPTNDQVWLCRSLPIVCSEAPDVPGAGTAPCAIEGKSDQAKRNHSRPGRQRV